MRPRTLVLSLFLVGALALVVALPLLSPVSRPSRKVEPGPYPSDWFAMQRSFPYDRINQEAWRAAVEQAIVERAKPGLGVTANLIWEQAGPYNIGGRVSALAVGPGGSTVYLGSANGGVFKSTNSGVNWTPIFDQNGVFSIGALAIEPGNPDVVYCGTGEANASVDSFDGAGMYKSTDGGQIWSPLGLAATRRIGRVAVDPAAPNRIFVAAMGTQFSTGPDRGLYRSEDGGENWTKVLFVNDSTGVVDVVINPAHPETVYCATWERIRHYTYRRAFGPGCGIWRSIDHGTTWTRLQSGLPLPSDAVGRIGLAIAASRPSTVYAQIITGAAAGYIGLGLYRTTDGGATWIRRDASGFTNQFGGFGWYFGALGVDPNNPETVYAMGVGFVRSVNGGQTFSNVRGQMHVDQHAIWIDPANSSHIYVGNDGGFYSTTAAPAWVKSVDLPITQFYAGAIDPSNPARLLGGTQDNNSLQTAGSPTAWTVMLGGDGFQCLVHPTNPSIVFAEWQFCSDGNGLGRSTAGGAEGTFTLPGGIMGGDRFNWNTPIAMSPTNPNVMLIGSHRVYESLNNGVDYTISSPDLTTNPVTSLVFGTLTTLDISAPDPNTYWAGSDDGRVHRSTNGGTSWTDVSAGLPVRWVTRVTADPVSALTAYVTLSGFGQDEPLAHVYRTTDRGGSWTSISGNLPDVPANDILVDPADTNRLFLATDIGVYVSHDLGGAWTPLGQGLPLQAIFDITLHAPSRTLVAATHGRSQWKLDLNDLPVAVGDRTPPPRFDLTAPAPNPSRGETRLEIDLASPGEVEVAVYDPLGRRVRVLREGVLTAGRHAVRWLGDDERGRAVAPGVYYVRGAMRGGGIQVRRVVRIG